MDGTTFRNRSQTDRRSANLVTNAGKTGGKNAGQPRQLCHRIPNYILVKAYNTTDSQEVKRQLLAFGFSSDNIFRGKNNISHTEMEHGFNADDLTFRGYNEKASMMFTAIAKMDDDNYDDYSADSVSAILEAMVNNSRPFTKFVAELDMREFSRKVIKDQIKRARARVPDTNPGTQPVRAADRSSIGLSPSPF
jgi:hypothetical protein